MRIKQALTDLREGIRSKYPPCCIVQFCIDSFLGRWKSMTFRYVRGVEYTPCQLHMKAYHQDKTTARKQAIADANIDRYV